MITRLLLALLNGFITLITLKIVVVILATVQLASIGAVISPFIWGISLIIGALTFFGIIPDFWKNFIK